MTDPQQWPQSDANGTPQYPNSPADPAMDPSASAGTPHPAEGPPPQQPPGPSGYAPQPPGYGPPPPGYGYPFPPQQAPPPKKSNTGLIIGLVAGAVVLVLIAVVAVGAIVFMNTDDSTGSSADSSSDDTEEESVVEPQADTEDFAVVLGSGEPVIDVYVDFLCPACGSFAATHGPTLYDAAENDEATVRVQPLGFLDDNSTTEYSTRAAAASVCAADENAFFEYSEALFDNQPPEGDAGHDDAALAGFGEQMGLGEQFSDCVTAETYVAWINEGTELALSEGVDSTPTVLIDGKQLEPSEVDSALPDALD